MNPHSAPSEGHVSRAVAPLLHQWLVKLSAGPRVDAGPAVLAVVLQAGDVGTEEGGKLPPAARPLALITHLVIQDVRLHLHLGRRENERRRLVIPHPLIHIDMCTAQHGFCPGWAHSSK